MAKKITQIEINGETYNVGGSGESVSGNFINQVDDFSQYVPTKWNEIAQYVGTDTPLYKNGYFYKNSGSWIIPVDTPQIAFQSISVGGEHSIPIVSPLYEGLSSPVFVGSNAYYGMLSINPTVGGKIFDFLTGTINTITAVTDNGDETYICVTDGGAREETTTYTLDMTEEFDYTERVDAYKNRFIVIEYTDISDYPSSMFGFYIVEETDPNTGTLVENYYPAGLNGCVVTRTTAPVVLDRGTWTQIDVQPTSSSGGSNALVGFILANNKVSIVPLVDCYIENGNLYDPTTHEQIYPTSDTYYYEINEEKVYTPDESYELVDVTSSVLFQPSVNQIVIEIRGNEAFRWNGWSYNQIVDSTKAPDVPTFSAAQTRENIKGDGTENTATLWGKIKKWFSDLKDLAFIGKPSANQTTTYLRGDGTWQMPNYVERVLQSANINLPTNQFVIQEYSAGTNYDLPSNSFFYILSAKGSDPNYMVQLALGETTHAVYYRRLNGGTWTAWKDLTISVRDGDLQWGAADGNYLRNTELKGLSASDLILNEIGGNGFAFIPASKISVEYTRDGGSTWVDYGLTDAQKISLLTLDNQSVGVGKNDSTYKATAAENFAIYQCRITIDTNGVLYSQLTKFIVNVTTNGSAGCVCDLYVATHGSPSTFTLRQSWTYLVGWSGYNVLNLQNIITTYGNRDEHFQYLRFVFRCAAAGNTSYTGLKVIGIKAFGQTKWANASQLAKTGHLYAYNELQTMILPTSLKLNGGRVQGSGDDEGIVVTPCSNNYATLCLGNPSGERSILTVNVSAHETKWRYNNGSANYDIAHPKKSGTIALTSDIPDISTKVSKSGDSMSGTLTFTTANAINYNANNGNISMIRFKQGDADGHGIIIGGGGLTVIGAGESASTVAAQTSSGGSGTMQVCSDANIEFYTNCQSGFSSAKKSYFDTSGDLHVNRYAFATHYNQSSPDQSFLATSSSYIMFANSDGYLRKATVAQIKSLVDTNTWRPLGTGASDACAGNDSRLSNSRPASDVYAWAKASTKPSYTASEVGALAQTVTAVNGSSYSGTSSSSGVSGIMIGSGAGAICIYSVAIRTSSSSTSISIAVPGTYQHITYSKAGDGIGSEDAVLKLTVNGYIQNESTLKSNHAYYCTLIGIRKT